MSVGQESRSRGARSVNHRSGKQWSRVARPLAGLGAGLLGAAVLLPGAPGVAQESARSFATVRLPRNGQLSPSAQAETLEGLARQDADPQHVVALIHGWDTPFYLSEKQFKEVAPRVHAEFGRYHERAAVLGVQWESNVGPQRKWVPAVFGHYFFGLFGLPKVIRDPYTSRIPISRTAGRTGLRQILFAVQDRFPKARVHIMGHSLGAEAVAHAINPEFTPIKGDRTPVFQPERPLRLDVVALAGADLDFDAGAKSKPVNPAAAPRMLWLTLPKVGSKGDKVLSLRKTARSKAAIGNAVPRFREDQYDALISQRRLIFDTIDIPSDHALIHYYQSPRIGRIAATAVGIRNPENNPSPLLKKLDEVLAARPDAAVLAPCLQGDETAPKIYALWRLEHLLCGNSAHMSNGYAEKVLARTLKDPDWWTLERGHTECRVVREGLWPPADVVAAARARAVGKRSPANERQEQKTTATSTNHR